MWVFAQGADGDAVVGDVGVVDQGAGPWVGVWRRSWLVTDHRSAAALGEYGAERVYATGDLGGVLAGVAVAAAMVAVIEGGDRPDLVLFPQNYEGRDVMARLSVKLDRTVLTNNTEIVVDGERGGGDDADLWW